MTSLIGDLSVNDFPTRRDCMSQLHGGAGILKICGQIVGNGSAIQKSGR